MKLIHISQMENWNPNQIDVFSWGTKMVLRAIDCGKEILEGLK